MVVLAHREAEAISSQGDSTQSSADCWRHGLVGRGQTGRRGHSLPDCPTNDCVMAQWFGEFGLPKMTPSPGTAPPEAAKLAARHRHVRLGAELAQIWITAYVLPASRHSP